MPSKSDNKFLSLGVPVTDKGFLDFSKLKEEDLDKFDETTRQWAKEKMISFQRSRKSSVSGW